MISIAVAEAAERLAGGAKLECGLRKSNGKAGPANHLQRNVSKDPGHLPHDVESARGLLLGSP